MSGQNAELGKFLWFFFSLFKYGKQVIRIGAYLQSNAIIAKKLCRISHENENKDDSDYLVVFPLWVAHVEERMR